MSLQYPLADWPEGEHVLKKYNDKGEKMTQLITKKREAPVWLRHGWEHDRKATPEDHTSDRHYEMASRCLLYTSPSPRDS